MKPEECEIGKRVVVHYTLGSPKMGKIVSKPYKHTCTFKGTTSDFVHVEFNDGSSTSAWLDITHEC